MARAASATLLLCAALVSGCALERRFFAVQPGVDQVLRVENGDRIYFEMEEDAATGRMWDFACDDQDVSVTIDHVRGKGVGSPGAAKVRIRVHRGYDGPSTVTFSLRRPRERKPDRSFTVTLFRRTGDAAFWR